ncbi:uncharacterized protein LOC125231217 [Leguminivora glycinivorella]|uniref:uncharacterized protein LOC125231217 n=1 Tax=Leguminivora glycinivorella TaxID=1035111 RepID=UPI00200E5DE2|nr:uncharacterized protein LOC125231217 [Leguminivora glycinivorella]XP_047992552.1 uncharacterized protein LOC125231217 [Leguminivora glycinivorella]
MRWSEKETCTFVKLYLENEALWNPRVPEYKSKPERHKAYTKIISDFRAATGMPLTEPEVRTKIKNLRSTYIQEVNKIRKRSSPDSVFKPSIKWFYAWHKHFSKRHRINLDGLDDTFLNHDKEIDESCQKIWVNPDEVNDNSNPDPFESEQDFLLVLKPEPGEDIKQEASSSCKVKKKKFKHRHSTDQSDRSYRNSIDEAKEDEFDIYGKFIASQLRKMNLQKALRLQLEIQSLVSEARISDITEH